MATWSYTVGARSDNTAYLWNGHGLNNEPDATIVIRAGDTITVTNTTGHHTMSLYNDPSVDNGSLILTESGGSWSYSNASEGTYFYVCGPHPTMNGSIIVLPTADDGSPPAKGKVGKLRGPASEISVGYARNKLNEIITKGVGGSSVTVEANAPSGASEGDLWYDDTNSALYVYVAGSLNSWVQTNGGGQGGGGSSGFADMNLIYSAKNNSMTAPVLIDDYIFEVTYGGTSTGYTIHQSTTDGAFVRGITPKVGAGSSTTSWSWPYQNTTGWAATWPQLWLDTRATNSSTAVIWCRHSGGHVFKMLMNRSTGTVSITKMSHSNPGGALNTAWNIVASSGNHLYSTYGYENSGVNYSGSVKVYVNTYNGSNTYTSAQKYLQDNRTVMATGDRPLMCMPTNNRTQNYEMIIGVNDVTGRVYIQNRGFNDFVSVWQIASNGSSGYYQDFANGLWTSNNTTPSGSYKLNYVKSWMPPSTTGYEQSGIQCLCYQVHFDPDDGTPLAISKGGHGSSWNYGGSKMWSWNPDWT